MHIHLKIASKWAVHFRNLAIPRFNSSTKLFQAVNSTLTLRASLLLNVLSRI